ncbi:class E sortase [Candidatus Peregrinibacteria bacterium]|nr:class E sortase [Candidatus Peregrinibacteria bacterium]
MHIDYKEEITDLEQKISFSEKFWQFVRFTVVTGMIFSVSFFALNFSAYKQIFEGVINPDAQAKAQETLEEAMGEGEIDSSLLLPVLPDEKDVKKQFAWPDMPIAPTDNRLVIPKMGKSVPLVAMSMENIQGENWNELEKQIQDGLRDGVVHYPGTAKPGQYGNVFLTGHSSYYPWDPGQFKDVFATLGQLEPGDRYYVYFDQIKYVYEVIDKKEVYPSDVTVLEQPHDKKVSTLMTCTPVGTALRRLIIHAEQVG